ncbi:MAG: hypothetical protein WAM14_24480 [Candidatus Nitrosopolaris sp.]
MAILMLGIMPPAYAHSLDYWFGYQLGYNNESDSCDPTPNGNKPSCSEGFQDRQDGYNVCHHGQAAECPILEHDMRRDYLIGYADGKYDALNYKFGGINPCSEAPVTKSKQCDVRYHDGYFTTNATKSTYCWTEVGCQNWVWNKCDFSTGYQHGRINASDDFENRIDYSMKSCPIDSPNNASYCAGYRLGYDKAWSELNGGDTNATN